MTDSALGVETVVDGLTEPTAIAVIGPDDLFVTEKSTGRVIRVQGGVASEPVLDLAVNFFDERGLLGIALHPRFTENGFVYLYWTASGEGEGDEGRLGPDTDEATAVPELGNRVDRFRWDGTALSFDRPIIAMRSNTLDTDTSGRIRGNHDAGPIVFGPDEKLYIVNGDQNLRGQLQNITEGSQATDADLTGVVLRLDDDGSTPEDNPFVAAATDPGGEVGENLAMIWAYGVRNSFGLAIHPDTGELWQTENGDDSWDEVNVLPAGSNSGWIQLIGPPERMAEYRDLEVASEDGLDNPDFPPDGLATDAEGAQQQMVELPGSRYVPPVFSWKYPVAVTSIAFVTDEAFGESSANTAWLGTVLTDGLYRYPLDAAGAGFDFGDDQGLGDDVDDNASKGDIGESAAYLVGTGFGIVTHIVRGPEDRLYVASLSGGAVYRIGPADQVGSGGTSPSPSPAASAPGNGGGGEVASLTIGTDSGAALLFDPDEATAPGGGEISITFENRSTVPHNLTFADPIDAATATVVPAGASETITFAAPEPGAYDFVCTLHPGMDGVLTVEAP
ncbi:MAG TPA: PQQ-dependent sugar dehydrogenase [Candidatus Saccharimonadales bacterium]|nr:PQQ-dependent sugar dehydrogenase [Candidatus Saccharimonadales bacterium]